MKNIHLLIALAGMAASTVVAANDKPRFTVDDATWREECGACHVAYPPRLLDAAAWQTIMRGLPEHFGTDASLDAATTAHIEDFLVTHADRRRASPGNALPRITLLPWFREEHEEVPRRVWQSEDVRNGVNCEACHRGAAEGDFNEDNIRLPSTGTRGVK